MRVLYESPGTVFFISLKILGQIRAYIQVQYFYGQHQQLLLMDTLPPGKIKNSFTLHQIRIHLRIWLFRFFGILLKP